MRKRLRSVLVSFAVLAVWGLSGAGASAYGQSLTAAPQPSTELQALTKALSGEWSLSVKFEPDATTPNGSVKTGEETWRPTRRFYFAGGRAPSNA